MREHQEKIPYTYIQNKYKYANIDDLCFSEEIIYNKKKYTFIVDMMGIKYNIEYPSGNIYLNNGDEITSYVLKTILLRYLVNGKGKQPTNQFITYKELQDGQVYYPNFHKRTIMRLGKLYDNNPEYFDIDCPEKSLKELGDMSFSFKFLPNIYFLFVMYAGDEEFSPSANILMDKNIEDYFNAEDLAVVVDVAIDFFLNGGYIPKDLGMYDF